MASSQLQRSVSKLITKRSLSVLSSISNQRLWTSDNIVKSPHRNIEIPNLLIPEKIFENIDKWSEKTAVVCGITNHSYTYNQLYKYSKNLAARLRTKFKIKDGDVINLMMSNSPEYCAAVLGVLRAGAVVSTINPTYTSYEVFKQIDQVEPKIIFTAYEAIPIIKKALRLAQKDIPIVLVKTEQEHDVPPNSVSFHELLEDVVDDSILKEVKNESGDTAFLLFSSGTTGLPKGVELSHKNIVTNCCQKNVDTVKINRDTTETYQDSVSAVLPFYHIYGLMPIMLTNLAEGVKLVTLPKFQPNTYLKSLSEHKISVLCCVPSMVSFLGSHSDVKKQYLEHTHTLTCSAAPLLKQDINAFKDRAMPNVKLTQIYGVTETSPVITISLPGFEDSTSVGHALSNTELKIVDENCNALGPDQEGELWMKGPQIMKGYKNNPEATTSTITVDGWLKTGDLAAIGENGALYIKDRLKELIKVKGHQVAPAELENVIKEHPSVKDVAVIGIPDERNGEAPKAYIVLNNASNTSSDDINSFVNHRVTSYKRLKEIKFVNEIPRNPSGKILRRVLKDS